MAYATTADVQALMPRWTLSATTTPSTAQVSGLIDDISGQIDAVLSGQGVSVPVTTPASFLAWLGRLNALGAGALAVAGMFPSEATSGPAGTALAGFLERFYRRGLDMLRDGSAIPADASKVSGGLATSYLQQHPDTEVADGDIDGPWFTREKVF